MTECTIEEVGKRLKLHNGLSYCVVMSSESQRQPLLDALSRWRPAAIVNRDGGLLGNLTAAENIALPVRYHEEPGDRIAPYTSALFERLGLIEQHSLQALLKKLPEQMSAYEMRLIGFMRAMYMEPDLMLYDRIYDGLALRELELVARFDKFFHLYFPFRTSVLLSFENFNHPAGTHSQTIYLDDALT